MKPKDAHLKRVIVDFKTTIFIAKNADPEKARRKYQEQMYNKYIKH